ncbi:hypothetical protein ACFX19_017486 [Malus domestica]
MTIIPFLQSPTNQRACRHEIEPEYNEKTSQSREFRLARSAIPSPPTLAPRCNSFSSMFLLASASSSETKATMLSLTAPKANNESRADLCRWPKFRGRKLRATR